jgi:lipid-binding SYLF domain-containing protein
MQRYVSLSFPRQSPSLTHALPGSRSHHRYAFYRLRSQSSYSHLLVFKAGFLGSGRFGSGLVVARLSDGSWSAPSAIGTVGGGFGGQIGFELTDFVFILNDAAAVKTFAQAGSITLGGNVSIAAGPVGRNAEAAGAASLKGVSGVFAYSKTKGLFAGVSLEGSAIIERRDANEKLYGRAIKAAEILRGGISPPTAADSLMAVLNSGIFAGRASANSSSGDAMYNDIPVYDDSHDEVVWQGSRGSAYGEGVRTDRTGNGSMAASRDADGFEYRRGEDDYDFRDNAVATKKSSTWEDDVYDRQPASTNARANPDRTFDGLLRTQRTGGAGADDYVYSDHTASTPKPSRPTAPKPTFGAVGAGGSARSGLGARTSSLGPNQAVAKFTFDAENPGDLGFKKGEVITITKKTNSVNDWWDGRIGDRTGIFPGMYSVLARCEMSC